MYPGLAARKIRMAQNEMEVLSKTDEETIAKMEAELESSKNMSHALSDHISALEAQIESPGDAEWRRTCRRIVINLTWS